jgi:hypothetical protein
MSDAPIGASPESVEGAVVGCAAAGAVGAADGGEVGAGAGSEGAEPQAATRKAETIMIRGKIRPGHFDFIYNPPIAFIILEAFTPVLFPPHTTVILRTRLSIRAAYVMYALMKCQYLQIEKESIYVGFIGVYRDFVLETVLKSFMKPDAFPAEADIMAFMTRPFAHLCSAVRITRHPLC